MNDDPTKPTDAQDGDIVLVEKIDADIAAENQADKKDVGEFASGVSGVTMNVQPENRSEESETADAEKPEATELVNTKDVETALEGDGKGEEEQSAETGYGWLRKQHAANLQKAMQERGLSPDPDGIFAPREIVQESIEQDLDTEMLGLQPGKNQSRNDAIRDRLFDSRFKQDERNAIAQRLRDAGQDVTAKELRHHYYDAVYRRRDAIEMGLPINATAEDIDVAERKEGIQSWAVDHGISPDLPVEEIRAQQKEYSRQEVIKEYGLPDDTSFDATKKILDAIWNAEWDAKRDVHLMEERDRLALPYDASESDVRTAQDYEADHPVRAALAKTSRRFRDAF